MTDVVTVGDKDVDKVTNSTKDVEEGPAIFKSGPRKT